MDAAGLAALITATVAALGTLGGGVAIAWRALKKQARAEYAAEQAQKTHEATMDENTELRAENAKLWALIDHMTLPPAEKS